MPILIEGYSVQAILELPTPDVDELVLTGESIVLSAGSAEILGSFTLLPDRMVVELAHIDGGGEGVLPVLWRLAGVFAKRRRLQSVEWLVHAVSCAQPNLKLRRVLEHRGFVKRHHPDAGEVYAFMQPVAVGDS